MSLTLTLRLTRTPSITAKNFLAGVGAGTIESIFGACLALLALLARALTGLLTTTLARNPPPHARWSSSTVVTPVETVKTKLIHLNMDFVRGVKHIVAKEGLSGVYQGLGATILKQVRLVCPSMALPVWAICCGGRP